MKANLALPAVNFFMADVGGGLGAFLSTWLAQAAHWNPAEIGTVIAAGSLAGALLAGPAGALVDRVARPRLLLAVACGIIVGGVLLLLPARAFWLVLLAQVIVAGGGALGSPSISGLTLAVVGKTGYPRQQGTNEAANHAGNVAAAGLVGVAAWMIGPTAPVAVLVVMAAATLVMVHLMDATAVDADRMRGRSRREKGAKRGATRGLFKNRRLLVLLAVVGLFQLANSAMLPLLGQRLVAQGSHNATSWVSAGLIVAQLTMVPVALMAGRLSDRVGRRWLLITACGIVAARCALAAFASENWWLVPVQVLDGLAAALFSVAAPVAVADLTYGTGRTQTALGGMGTLQAGGASLAGVMWGFSADKLGYAVTFGAMGVFAVAAILALLTIHLRDEGGQPETATGTGASGNAAAMSATV